MTARRIGVAVIGLLLAAAAVTGTRLHAAGWPAGAPVVAPVVARAATATAWYCSGATAQPGGQADGTLVLTNGGPRPLTGTVTLYSNKGGRPRIRPVALGAYSSGSLKESLLGSAPFAAAVVVFEGPGGSADQEVSGPLGVSAVPCATTPGTRWYFPSGTTRTGTTLLLALFNPFPEDALADLSFSASGQTEAPAAFQGLYVPGGSLVMVDLGQHVVESADVATAVTVRTGRLVASELQLDTVSGQVGLNLVTGVPAANDVWRFPDGVVAPGVDEQIHVFDPGTRPAQVRISLLLAQGQASPIELTVEPGTAAVVDLARQSRLPRNDPHATVVESSGAPVVASRSVRAGPPASRSGSAVLLGCPLTATRWQLGAGGTTTSQDEWVVVLNPGRVPATVGFERLAGGSKVPVAGLGSLVVPPGGRSAFRLGDHIQSADLALQVGADHPIVVERDIYLVGSPGIALACGDPVG